MTEQELLQLFKSEKSPVSKFTIIGINSAKMTWLNDKIQFQLPLVEKAYLFLNEIASPPKCLECNNLVKFKGFTRGYAKTCSKRCNGKLNQRLNGSIIKEKSKSTLLKNHGVSSPFLLLSSKQKARENHFRGIQSEETKFHRRETLKLNYGVISVSQIPAVRNKIDQTMKEKYGNYYVSSLTGIEHRKKIWLDKKISLLKDVYLTELLEEYSHSKADYRAKCLTCKKEFQLSIANGQISKCPKCFFIPANRSLKEQAISEFVESLGFIVETNVKKKDLIYPYTLDIWIPEKRIAIEFNGNYWHREEFIGKNYHLNKMKMCLDKNIELIQIFEYEYDSNRRLIESRIKSLLGKSSERVGARELELRSVSKVEADIFFKENHVQGSLSSMKMILGLWKDNCLMMAAAFGRSRFDKSIDYELLRIATKKDFTIPGGASKLLKEFMRSHEGKLISYHDNRWGRGSFYQKLGFKKIRETLPGYVYVKGSNVIKRLSAQKHKLKDLLGNQFDETLTESENMIKAKFNKLWDCGQSVFILDK